MFLSTRVPQDLSKQNCREIAIAKKETSVFMPSRRQCNACNYAFCPIEGLWGQEDRAGGGGRVRPKSNCMVRIGVTWGSRGSRRAGGLQITQSVWFEQFCDFSPQMHVMGALPAADQRRLPVRANHHRVSHRRRTDSIHELLCTQEPRLPATPRGDPTLAGQNSWGSNQPSLHSL